MQQSIENIINITNWYLTKWDGLSIFLVLQYFHEFLRNFATLQIFFYHFSENGEHSEQVYFQLFAIGNIHNV